VFGRTDPADGVLDERVPPELVGAVLRPAQSLGRPYLTSDGPRLVRRLVGRDHRPSDRGPFRRDGQRRRRRAVGATATVVRHPRPTGMRRRPSDRRVELGPEIRASGTLRRLVVRSVPFERDR